MSTPLGAAPDEPDQMVQAAAVVRGQYDGPQIEDRDGRTAFGLIGIVSVPKWVANIDNQPGCFLRRPNVSAGCSPGVGNATRTVPTGTQFSKYPPLYYSIVGIPSLLSTGSEAFYGMRITAALIDSLLIAMGLFLLARYHPRRLVFLGAMVALSPMVLFLTAIVNSSGLEISAGFVAWCGGLCVVERTVIPRALAILTALAFVVLVLSRPISPVNAGVIIVVLGTFIGWTRCRALLSERSFRPLWIAVLIAMVVAAVGFLVIGMPTLLGVPERPPLSAFGSVWLTLRLTGDRLRQCIGDFGWLDTPAPTLVVVAWTTAAVGLLGYGLAVSRRCRRAIPLLALGILVMPVIFESPQINAVRPYWEGRYWLPLVMGLPLVASAIKTRSAQIRPALAPLKLAGFVITGLILGIAQIAAFLTALHRYETGLGAKPGSPVQWTPPGGTVLVVTLFVIGQMLLLNFLTWKFMDTGGSTEFLADRSSSNELAIGSPGHVAVSSRNPLS